MKKIILTIIFLLICSSNVFGAEEEIFKSQMDSLDISSFINKSKQYTKEIFPDLELDNFLTSAIKGNIDNKGIIKSLLGVFGSEFKELLKVVTGILIIIIVHSILNSFSSNLENSNVSQISFYVQYILIVTLVMSNFADIIKLVNESIQNLVSFIYSLLPILITLMISTGSIASGTIIQPIILLLIQFIGNVITSFVIPIILVGTVLGIISNISDKVSVNKMSKYLKSWTLWFVGIVLTLFVTVLSLEGTMTASVDGITAKTTKAAVSTVIPVVGKILGDAVDTVIGCAGILKNAIGVVGIVIILGICVVPVIKLTLFTCTYYIIAAIAEPLADKKIINLLETIGDTFKILLGLMTAISFMVIIGVTIVIKISNSGLMYR